MSEMQDIANTCWTCEPLRAYVDLTGDFVDRLSDALQSPMLILFGSLAGLWIVASGIKLVLKMTDQNQIIKDFVFISITGVLLGSLGVSLISYVYTSAISIMSGTSASVFEIAAGQQSTGETGLVALAANGEMAVVKVFQAAQAIARATNLYNLPNIAYAIVLILPYFLLVVVYSSQVVVAIFRATVVGIFAPFLFMVFAFGWGRDMAKSGVKTLLAAITVLFASTAALSLTIYGVNAFLELDPNTLSNDAINEFASISNPQFLVVLFLGWMGTALQTEGVAIANSIAQTALTNTAAGILTGGVSASALFAAKKGIPGAGKAAAAVSRGYFWGQRAMADPQSAVTDLVNKFQNINKPGGKS